MAKTPTVEIKIGGQTRPVRFGFNAMAEFCDSRDMALADLDGMNEKSLKVGDVRELLYVGLKYGARKRSVEFDHTRMDVGDWMEDFDEEAFGRVMEVFAASQGEPEEGEEGNSQGPEERAKPTALKTGTTS